MSRPNLPLWGTLRWVPGILLAAVLLAAAPAPQATGGRPGEGAPSSPAQDEDFARMVREWTTRPEFLSPLVDHLPKLPDVPSPKDVLGYHAGAPRTLTYAARLRHSGRSGR